MKHHRGDTPSWGRAPPLNHVPEGMRFFICIDVRELLLCTLSCWPVGALYYRSVTLTVTNVSALLSIPFVEVSARRCELGGAHSYISCVIHNTARLRYAPSHQGVEKDWLRPSPKARNCAAAACPAGKQAPKPDCCIGAGLRTGRSHSKNNRPQQRAAAVGSEVVNIYVGEHLCWLTPCGANVNNQRARTHSMYSGYCKLGGGLSLP